ncbi:hypothetical protein SAMN05216537_11216 [Lachnospira multipara]|uniref:Secreted protein n=1 Tax=Lachnospira multipara TaxID=28051 RepID=A0A1H5VPN2_9FIRM|nr:hypothetical protein SAMN05216537_11216 [Lachnospira multipara]
MNRVRKILSVVLSLTTLLSQIISYSTITYAATLNCSYQEEIIPKKDINHNIYDSFVCDLQNNESSIEDEVLDTDFVYDGHNDTTEELPLNITTIYLPEYETYTGFKSYMDYRALSNVSSDQYALQLNSYTGDLGIRMYNGRYLVAIGSYFGLNIGDEFDIMLENGTIIPAVMGDLKDDNDTDVNNVYTVKTNCCTEFIIDSSSAATNIFKRYGDVSYAAQDWNSKVVAIQIIN